MCVGARYGMASLTSVGVMGVEETGGAGRGLYALRDPEHPRARRARSARPSRRVEPDARACEHVWPERRGDLP